MLNLLSRLAIRSPRHRQLVSMTPAVAIVLLAAALALLAAREASARRWVEHTHEVRAHVAAVRQRLAEFESGVRGYFVTGDSQYVALNGGAERDVLAGLAALRRLTGDQPAQQARLDTLDAVVRARLDTAHFGVALAERAGTDSVLAWMRMGGGLRLMRSALATLAAVDAHERALLAARQARADRVLRATALVFAVGTVVALAAALAMNLALAAALREAQGALAALGERARELDLANAQLQEQASELEATTEQLQDQATELEASNEALGQQQEQLKVNELRLAGIVDGAMDAIVSVDDRQRIVVFNPAAERVFRCAAADAIGAPLSRFVPARHRGAHEHHVRSFSQTGRTTRPMGGGDLVGVRADGTEFPMEATISTHGSGEGRLHTAILRDVSERQLLEGQLRQAQKMDVLGQFAGGIAHDFNNLLMVMSANLQFVRDALHDRPDAATDLAEVEKGVGRATSLVKQLLAFSRKQVLQPRRLELNAVVRDAEGMLRRLLREDFVLDVHLDPAAGRVLADPAQLDQVLLNLVANARDATPGGGVIGVETGRTLVREDDRARWNGVPAGEYACLAVRDEGLGMDATTLARVFEPFFTTKPVGEGTGLGLPTVYGIAAQTGGTARVESAPGRGTTVTVLLPALTGAGDAPAPPPPAAPSEGRETVLLVEDESAVRLTLRRILERHGYTVLEARHGGDALHVWHSHAEDVALVLTDVRMPEMGGHELAEALRAADARVPLLFMSGYADAVPANGTRYLEKPFSAHALLTAVRELIDTSAR